MPERIIAIGDIHGYLAAFSAILRAIDPQPNDTIVALGDFVDRGPDSRGVIDRVIALKRGCRLVPILGNHDEMLLDICHGRMDMMTGWLIYGGDATLSSYDGRIPGSVPEEHIKFLESCLPFYETDRHFFVHASYYSNLPLSEQPDTALRWESLRHRTPFAHYSGKTAVVGHTAQKGGDILDLGYLKCIDTWIYGNGWLTAVDVESGQIWQADKDGNIRS
jgi:serine/threonine protein phosphatase 1